MNTQANLVREAPLERWAIASPLLTAARHLYWSVRRELWENRWIYRAPVVVAGLYLVGSLISMIHLPNRVPYELVLSSHGQHQFVEPYNFAALLIMGSTFILALFYSLDALYGERRDRSILFWKSLPVSDLTTVLAKASVPIVILPLLTFALTVATQWIMLLLNSVVLLAQGQNLAILWNHASWFEMWMGLLYHLVIIHGLYYAPIYGWLLLVSAWATRAPFLWAILAPFAIAVAEKISFNTAYFAAMLEDRLAGGSEGSKWAGRIAMDASAQLRPVPFLISPGLWLGLLITALFLFAAVRLRRYRGPI